MRLGLGSYAYGWAVGGVPGHPPPARPMTAFGLLERAASMGVRVVQYADNLPLGRLPAAERAALRRDAEAAGVRVELGTRGIAPGHLRAQLALAAEFGADLLRVVTDTAEHRPTEAEAAAALREVAPEFERAGVCLAVENHDRFPAAALRRLMEAAASPAVGVCLDTANSFGAQEGVASVADALAPWVANLHVKDYAVRRLPHLMGFLVEGRPAGQGDLDVPWLLALVRARAPRPVTAVLELWPPPEPALDATLAKEAEWVAASVRYLRALIPE